ncbi:unnamed protein product, partial [Diatraea saccharalis]
MAKEKSKNSEEELQKRRIARRERYKKLKSDPEKYAIEKAKKKEAYMKRKREKKVKSINEMSPREQRAQRKRWKENSKRYQMKKTKERKMQEVTVSQINEAVEERDADDDSNDPLSTTYITAENKDSKVKRLQNRIKTLKLKYYTEKREMTLLIKKYQNRCQILTNKINKLEKRGQTKEQAGLSISSFFKKRKSNV